MTVMRRQSEEQWEDVRALAPPPKARDRDQLHLFSTKTPKSERVQFENLLFTCQAIWVEQHFCFTSLPTDLVLTRQHSKKVSVILHQPHLKEEKDKTHLVIAKKPSTLFSNTQVSPRLQGQESPGDRKDR